MSSIVCGKDNSRNIHWKLGMSVCFREKRILFSSVFVEDIKMDEKKQNMAPTWKKLMKNVGIYEPTSFLDHVYLGCTQRACKPNENIIEEAKKDV